MSSSALRVLATFPIVFICLPLWAADNPPSSSDSRGDLLQMEHITVEATKMPLATGDVTGSVTVVDAERIQQELAQDIADLIRYEPGIDVSNQGSRFGLSGFNIRGIGGNRVQIEVDGVAVSNAFSIGSFSNASRDFVDVAGIQQVEIVRGPASALFGSDAVGGVVSFVSKTPFDYLSGSDLYLDTSAGFNGVDESTVLSGTAAARFSSGAFSIRAIAREGQERDTPLSDPLDDSSINAIASFAYGSSPEGAVLFTLDHFEADSETEVDSLERVQDFTASFGFPYVIDTETVRADDRRTRTRLSISQQFSEGALGADFLRWRVYQQNSETRQETFEGRSSLIGATQSTVERDRSFLFSQDLLGMEINAANNFSVGRVRHQLSYGVEYELNETSQLRDGTELDVATNELSNRLGPDVFPLRDFPESETTRTGVYVQNRMEFGALTLVPGVRWDRYELDPLADEIFASANPGIVPVSLDEEEFSPKLGALFDVNENWQLFANYARGFRAPPVNDVNVGFTNLTFGYTTLPNPDLQSESSEGLELGVRQNGQYGDWELAVFHTRYDDFIESFSQVGFDPVNQIIQFQSVNLDDVEISGAEFRGFYDAGALLEGLTVQLSAAWAEGENTLTGVPINSVSPLNAVLGLDYRSLDDRWGIRLVTRAASSQDDIDNTNGARLQPGGYAVFDTFAFYKPTEKSRIRAGVYNLADRDYTAYLDVAGLAATVANPERFARPGRYFNLAIDWTF